MKRWKRLHIKTTTSAWAIHIHELLTNLCTYIGYDTVLIGSFEVISNERMCSLKYLPQYLDFQQFAMPRIHDSTIRINLYKYQARCKGARALTQATKNLSGLGRRPLEVGTVDSRYRVQELHLQGPVFQHGLPAAAAIIQERCPYAHRNPQSLHATSVQLNHHTDPIDLGQLQTRAYA